MGSGASDPAMLHQQEFLPLLHLKFDIKPSKQGSRVMLLQQYPSGLACVFAVALSAAALATDGLGVEPYRLKLEAPIETWDEAIPLGNGLTGGLLNVETDATKAVDGIAAHIEANRKKLGI